MNTPDRPFLRKARWLLVCSACWLCVAHAHVGDLATLMRDAHRWIEHNLPKAQALADEWKHSPRDDLRQMSAVMQMKIWVVQERYSEALAFAQAQVANMANDSEKGSALTEVCWLAMRAQQNRVAEQACEQALQLDTELQGLTTAYVGHLFLLRGDMAQAQRWYNDVVGHLDESEDFENQDPMGRLAKDFDWFTRNGLQAEKAQAFKARLQAAWAARNKKKNKH